MIRYVLVVLFIVVAVATTGCSRHVVSPREAGEIDGARSISTSSDAQWTIRSEPDRN